MSDQTITDEQLHILRHSLGLSETGQGREYRDYYCDGVPACADMQTLVELGLMEPGRKINEGRDQYFHVTEAGRAASRREHITRMDNRNLRLTVDKVTGERA